MKIISILKQAIMAVPQSNLCNNCERDLARKEYGHHSYCNCGKKFCERCFNCTFQWGGQTRCVYCIDVRKERRVSRQDVRNWIKYYSGLSEDDARLHILRNTPGFADNYYCTFCRQSQCCELWNDDDLWATDECPSYGATRRGICCSCLARSSAGRQLNEFCSTCRPRNLNSQIQIILRV